jgi:hypothetical protein
MGLPDPRTRRTEAKMRRSKAIVVGVFATLLFTTGPALAVSPAPWSPLTTSNFELAAGLRCDFTLRGEVLSGKERIRVLETYPDGSPRVYEIVGQLIVRYTNVETGESVTRNLTGTALQTIEPDGSFTLTLVGGHMAVGFGATDDPSLAFLIFSGAGHEVYFGTDGTRTATFGDGPVEDICETLA